MKKRVDTEIMESIDKIAQKLIDLEKKIDILISKSSSRPSETKSFTKPFQQLVQTYNKGPGMQDNGFRERVLHKATCADCRKECEVPFKPSGERPVYCKECFSKRKANNSFKRAPDNRPGHAVPTAAVHIEKPQAAARKKLSQKKKPAARKKKSH